MILVEYLWNKDLDEIVELIVKRSVQSRHQEVIFMAHCKEKKSVYKRTPRSNSRFLKLDNVTHHVLTVLFTDHGKIITPSITICMAAGKWSLFYCPELRGKDDVSIYGRNRAKAGPRIPWIYGSAFCGGHDYF